MYARAVLGGQRKHAAVLAALCIGGFHLPSTCPPSLQEMNCPNSANCPVRDKRTMTYNATCLPINPSCIPGSTNKCLGRVRCRNNNCPDWVSGMAGAAEEGWVKATCERALALAGLCRHAISSTRCRGLGSITHTHTAGGHRVLLPR